MSEIKKKPSTRPLREELARKIRTKIFSKIKRAEAHAIQDGRKRSLVALYSWRFIVQIVRHWRRDRCPQQASGLAFQTILSLVPALAVAFALFRITGAMKAESALVEFLSTEYIPLSRDEISRKLLSLSENISFQSLGLAGLISTLLIAFSTFNSLESAINRIWRVEQRRSLPRRLATFYLTASLGPLLFGMSLYQAAQFGLRDGWIGAILSVCFAYSALFLTHYVLPATPVRAKAAALGALVTTLMVEAAKLAFGIYVTHAMDRYSGVYGTLATFPLFLIWIYWCWLMLLLGAETSHVLHNFYLLEHELPFSTLSLESELKKRVHPCVAIQLLTSMAIAQKSGSPGLSRFSLVQEFSLSADALRLIINRLERHGLVVSPKSHNIWQLAKSPDKIFFAEVIEAFQERPIYTVFHTNSPQPVELAWIAFEKGNQERAKQVSIQDMMNTCN